MTTMGTMRRISGGAFSLFLNLMALTLVGSVPVIGSLRGRPRGGGRILVAARRASNANLFASLAREDRLAIFAKGSASYRHQKREGSTSWNLLFFGAGDRGRTDTVSLPLDFESSTSANSITPAYYA